jgi:cytochrome c biogenesis protein CcdA
MKKYVPFSFGLASLLVPVMTFAQTPQFGYVNRWVDQIQYYLRVAITIVMIAMTLWFLVSVFQFIAAKDATKQAEKKKQMINGLIGLFVAVAVWGIIRIAGRILGVDTQGTGGDAPIGITCPPGYFYDDISGTCIH